jgi:hypothetical protein
MSALAAIIRDLASSESEHESTSQGKQRTQSGVRRCRAA